MITLRKTLSGTLTARATFSPKRVPSAATAVGSNGAEATYESILTGGGSALTGWHRLLDESVLAAAKLACCEFWVRCAHQRLADQHGVHSDALELLDLLAVDDAGLGHDRLAGGHGGEQLEGLSEIDREVLEVAVVDPDHADVQLERGFELLLAVDLDESVEVERVGLLVEARQVVGVEGADHEEHGVGTGGARLVELVRVECEVLAQDRERARRARVVEILKRPAEVLFLGEHRHRGRAAALV